MRNGELESDDLVAVDGLYLAPAAASGWTAMREACRDATGVDLRIARPYGAYRSLVAQRVMYDDRASYGVAIAKPGFSTHGLGMAVDATLPTYRAAADWLKRNCTRFGFTVPPAHDPNHFAHQGTTPSGGSTPMATVTEIWGKLSTVVRGKTKPTVLQEIASTRTIVENIQARLNAPVPAPVTLTPADVARIAAQLPAAPSADAIAAALIAHLTK